MRKGAQILDRFQKKFGFFVFSIRSFKFLGRRMVSFGWRTVYLWGILGNGFHPYRDHPNRRCGLFSLLINFLVYYHLILQNFQGSPYSITTNWTFFNPSLNLPMNFTWNRFLKGIFAIKPKSESHYRLFFRYLQPVWFFQHSSNKVQGAGKKVYRRLDVYNVINRTHSINM